MGKRCLKHVRIASASGLLLLLATGAVEAEQAPPGPGNNVVPPPQPDLTCTISVYLDSLRGTPVTQGQVILFTGTRKVFYLIHAKNAGTSKALASQTEDHPQISPHDHGAVRHCVSQRANAESWGKK